MSLFLEKDVKLYARSFISKDVVHKFTFNIYK